MSLNKQLSRFLRVRHLRVDDYGFGRFSVCFTSEGEALTTQRHRKGRGAFQAAHVEHRSHELVVGIHRHKAYSYHLLVMHMVERKISSDQMAFGISE